MAAEWVIYAGPSLYSKGVEPVTVEIEDAIAEKLDDADPEAWAVLLAIFEVLHVDS